MAYSYKTSYAKDALDLAVGAVRRKSMSVRQAAVEYGVPRSTLHDHVRQVNDKPAGTRGRHRELSDEEESALAGYLVYMANQGVPASRKIVRMKVVDILMNSGSAHRVNLSSGPSDKWFRSFLSRHKLSDRLAENMDAARASMSTETVIAEFFDFFEKTLEEYGIKDKPEQIFNCDETGWTGKEKCSTKFIAPVEGHVFKRRITSGGHVTAQICVCASGRFLPSLVIFQGSIPHRRIEGVPESWLFAASDTGFINTDIFYQWLEKCFIPNCGKARPVLLVMDNHDSHVSINTVKAAIENDIVLLGFPGHTTHILQPLDVKIFGPLKSRFNAICNNLGHTSTAVTIGKSRFPAILRHAIDLTTPASIQRAFEVTGLCPVNRMAIDRSQLIQSTFVSQEVNNGKETAAPETCPTCGNFTVNPLVVKGIVPECLGKILLPPPVKPLDEKKKSKKRVERGRVLSTTEMLNELKEREKQEEEKRVAIERRKKEAEERKVKKAAEIEERRIRRDAEKAEKAEKRKKEDEEKEARKRLREEKRQEKARKKASGKPDMAAIMASSFVCDICGECGRVDDEDNGIAWYGCDGCDRWYHDCCLSISELWYVRTSLNEESEWFCKLCKPAVYEE